MAQSPVRTYSCPIEVTVEVVGGRWKPVILWHLRRHKVLRHGELRRMIPGITQKVLTQQLRQLQADGLVARTQYPEMPPRVEYAMTDYGQELQGLLDEFCAWGERHAQRAGISIVKPESGYGVPR
jgi:DNA-binding HxlR family transcriptional regulator